MLEFKVTLRVSSAKYSLRDLKEILGEPTRGFSIGDEYLKGKRRREFSLWALESSKTPKDDLESHLEEILDFLDTKYVGLMRLSSDYETDLFCMLSSDNGQGGTVLSASTMKRISSFGLSLVLDVYASTPSDE